MKFRPGVLLVLVLVVITSTMTSCVREYVCECQITYSGQPALPDTLINRYEIKDTKKKAEQICADNSGEYTNGDVKTVEDCLLY